MESINIRGFESSPVKHIKHLATTENLFTTMKYKPLEQGDSSGS